MVINHVPMNHGQCYFYRFHNNKIDLLTENLPNLAEFLKTLPKTCPHKYFQIGPRSSSLTFKINNTKMHSISGHEISKLAEQALKNSNSREAHNNVELFLLQNDDKTVAVEVPLWLEPNELACYQEIFKSKDPLTGHIDILRVEDGKIWIWDFKPNAQKEQFAMTQTFFYAFMLSKRTKIPLENFRCGYFDQKSAFVFKPEEEAIAKNELLEKFL